MLLLLARQTLKDKLNAKLQSQKDICVDCKQSGHLNKYSYLFTKYVQINKRKFSGKDDYATKQAKAKGRKMNRGESSSLSSVVRPSCNTPGHSSLKSFACPNDKPTKDEVIKATYGGNYEVYARKVYLKTILREKYTPFIERVTALSDFICNITFRAQIFINYLAVENKERMDHGYIKEQNFWYSICQLIMGEKVTNKII